MKSTHQQYNQRLERVIIHIRANLKHNLRLNDLCAIACFSPFHFHRQFRYATGLPLNRFIRLTRMKQACYELAYKADKKIGEISQDADFSNAESFTRAFRALLNTSPQDFRQQPDWERVSQVFSPLDFSLGEEPLFMQVNITSITPIPVAALEFQGNPQKLHHSVQQFIAWRKSSGQSPVSSSMTIGVPWSDPATTEPEEFRFDICGSLQEGEQVAGNDFGVVNKTIAGGRYAVLRHEGSTDLIDKPCYQLLQQWLPESGEQLRDSPLFFHYIKRMPEVAEHEQLTDIYLPLK